MPLVQARSGDIGHLPGLAVLAQGGPLPETETGQWSGDGRTCSCPHSVSTDHMPAHPGPHWGMDTVVIGLPTALAPGACRPGWESSLEVTMLIWEQTRPCRKGTQGQDCKSECRYPRVRGERFGKGEGSPEVGTKGVTAKGVGGHVPPA